MNEKVELGHPRGSWPRVTLAAAAGAQLGPACTASLLNRSVQVNEDGSFYLADVPDEAGLQRVRVHCTPEGGALAQGQSTLFQMIPDGLVTLTGIDFDQVTPIPEALQVEVFPGTLTRRGEAGAIEVTGILADGSGVDMNSRAEGTEYWVSEPRIASLVYEPTLDSRDSALGCDSQCTIGALQSQIRRKIDDGAHELTILFHDIKSTTANNLEKYLQVMEDVAQHRGRNANFDLLGRSSISAGLPTLSQSSCQGDPQD